jgi:excisionase family DNA binding protein
MTDRSGALTVSRVRPRPHRHFHADDSNRLSSRVTLAIGRKETCARYHRSPALIHRKLAAVLAPLRTTVRRLDASMDVQVFWDNYGPMNTLATPEFLAPSEVARRLGLSRSTVYRRIQSGDLPALRLGRDGTTLRVRADELEAWLTPVASEEGP